MDELLSPRCFSCSHLCGSFQNLNSWNRLTIVRILRAVSFASCPYYLFLKIAPSTLRLQTCGKIIGISAKSSTLTRANNNHQYFPSLSCLTTLKVPGGYLGLLQALRQKGMRIKNLFADRSFRLRVVSLTSHSLTSDVVPLRGKRSRLMYPPPPPPSGACICFVLSALIQKSAIRMYIPCSFSH